MVKFTMEFLTQKKDRLIIWLAARMKFMVCCVVGGMLVYAPMSTLGLVNDMDGIWHTSNFVAGNWEISLGRGLLRYFDKLRFGVVSTSLNAVLYLCILSLALAVILEFFSIENKFQAFLLAAAVISNPVVCATLSYCFTSIGYGLAFLFSAVSAYCIVHERTMKGYFSFAGSACLAISMACYQAYFGVACLLLALMLCKKMVQKTEMGEIKRLLVSAVSSIFCGGVLYFLLVKALLFKSGMSLASYRGASGVSVFTIFSNLPSSIAACYRQFYSYFRDAGMFASLPGIHYLTAGIWVCAIGLIVCQMISFFECKRYAILLLAFASCIPPACNAVLIVAPGNSMSILMSMGMALSVVLLPAVFSDHEKGVRWSQRGYSLLVALLCWFQLFAVANDQLALQEGKMAVVALAENVTHKLLADGYMDDARGIALIGRPAENPMFHQSAAYGAANGYAQFGKWSTEAGNYRRSWMGVLEHYCGVNLNVCGPDQYDSIRQMDVVKEMPVFPLDGSIRVVDDFVVVKISDLY